MTSDSAQYAESVATEDRIAKVFAAFGWAVTDDFKREYETVSTVYHLTNGLVALAEENERLRRQIDGYGAPDADH